MTPPFSRTLPALLEEQASKHGARAAVISTRGTIRYDMLARRAAQLAAGLRALGVRRGDRVGLIASNRPEWLEVCFGATGAGAVLVPVSTWSTPAELRHILADAGVTALFSMGASGKDDFIESVTSLLSELPRLTTLIALDPTEAQGWRAYETLFIEPPLALIPSDRPSAVDDALLLYTSGSTSKPKAVRLAHYGLIENGFNIGERQGLRAGDKVFASVPLFWAYGSANALPATLTHGAALVLQERFEPGHALRLIESQSCSAIYTLPGMTHALISHPDFDRTRTRSLRTGLTIGTPQDVMNAATVLGASQVCNIYGSSETYGNCCVTPHDWSLEQRAACQGPPLPGMTLRLVDPETGTPVSPGQPGLIEVSGYVMPGYAGQSAVHNATAFTADGWYRTGDMGLLTPEGAIQFLGRNSEMIKRAGINVSPAEVEEVLAQHPGVATAAVVGTPDAARGEAIYAFLIPEASSPPIAEDVLAHCRTLLSSYKLPDHLLFCEALPTTPTGKLQRQVLKDDAARLHRERQSHVA